MDTYYVVLKSDKFQFPKETSETYYFRTRLGKQEKVKKPFRIHYADGTKHEVEAESPWHAIQSDKGKYHLAPIKVEMIKAIPPGLVPKKVPVKGPHGSFQATRYVKSGSSEKAYMDQVSKIPLLGEGEQQELANKYFYNKDPEAAKKLIESNLWMVVQWAHKKKHYGVSFGDLVQEGTLGLYHALEKFNPTKGAKFSTYAFNWIRHFMTQFANRSLWKEPGADVGESGSAGEEGEPRTSLKEQITSTLPLPGEELEQRELEGQIAQAMKKLDEREVHVIRARILTDEPKTLEEVGVELGLTKMRIKQIETSALGKLRIEMGKSFYILMSYLEDLQKAFRLAEFHGGEAEKETRRKERDESGDWSQRDLRMKRLARRRKKEVAPPSW